MNLQGLSARLRQAREKAGLTQREAGQRLDRHCETITEIEGGRRKVTAEELVAFARLYNVTLNWLADVEEDQRVLEIAQSLRSLLRMSLMGWQGNEATR